MRLFVVIGYPDHRPTAEPFSVYVGCSGADKIHAMNRSTAARFLVLDNPIGIRKNNPHAETNRAKAAASAPPAAAAAPRGRRT